MSRANARLTPAGRRTLVDRIQHDARPIAHIAHIAHEMGISRATASRWWARYQQLGEAGLVDRTSRPHRSPLRTPREVEQRILQLRRRERLGPARIAARLGARVHGLPGLGPLWPQPGDSGSSGRCSVGRRLDRRKCLCCKGNL